jgi:hypothetical protein
MTLALQWSLDKTANSSLSFSRGLIAAATSDNVEPLAVAACEKFGTTLPICRDSCAKVERLVEPQRPVFTFLGAYIGYSANDCATQLVKSVAGVQFFALAAALVSSIGELSGAQALEILLEKTAVDKTQVPPAGLLEPLLKALEPRCTSLRFLDSAVYCRNLLVQSQNSAQSKAFWKGVTEVPHANAIARLVLALSKLKESAPSSKLEIRAGSTTPWVIAFTSWVFGAFPSIAFDNEQPFLTSQQCSRVTVTAVEDLFTDLDMSLYTDLNRLSELITRDQRGFDWPGRSWSGMVSVKAYGQLLRDEFDLSSDCVIRSLTDILPYAIHQCLTPLRTKKDTTGRRPESLDSSLGQITPSENYHFTLDENLSWFLANPFGQDANIRKAISLMLGLSSERPPIGVKPLADDAHFHDLPAIQNYLSALKRYCTCAQCKPTTTRTYRQCRKEKFWRDLACLVTDILCLSFFENLDELAVSLHQDRDARAEVSRVVSNVLARGDIQPYSVVKFYDWALALVGYSESLRMNNSPPFPPRRILSSVKGQVTYLKLFETRSVVRRGYMTLAWARGQLRFEGVEYPAVVEPKLEFLTGTALNELQNGAIICPQNIYPNYSMEWVARPVTTPRRESLLELRAAVCRGSDSHRHVISTHVNPFNILESLAQSLILEGCEHNSDTPLDTPDTETRYAEPLLNYSLLPPEDDKFINCVAVAGDNGLRLLTFGSQDPPFPMVFRGNACLECALYVCRKAKSRLLIM